jgi:parallel beta-helix repeat protein
MTEITVSSTAQLTAALSNAKGGDTIVLASGFSGNLWLTKWQGIDITYDAPVTIRSADPSNPAVFSQLTLRDASNIVFQDVKFDYTFKAGDPEWTSSVEVGDSSNISFVNCTFDGDVAQGVSAAKDGLSYGGAIGFGNCTNVTIKDSDISGYANGASFGNCDGVTFVNNEVHDIRSDGLKLYDVKGVLVEGNNFHDFRPSMAAGDHPDMIQLHSSGATEASRDIIIRGNIFDIGEGLWTQTVFMKNEAVSGGAGTAMYYSNILIENNTITNAHLHGILVGETNGLVIRNNTVVHADGGLVDGADGGVEIPGIQVAPTSTAVQILQNVTAGISGYTGQTGWTVANNVIAQDQNPTAANSYGALFDSASLVATNGQHLFRALTGGVIDQLNAGSSLTQGAAGAP